MLRRLLLGFAAVCGAAAVVLGGGWGSREVAARSAGAEHLASLVEQFSTGSSADVVSQLEASVAADPSSGRTHALLGVAYQQLFRETARPEYLSRARTSLEAAAELDEEDFTTQIGLAQVSATQHRFRAAERHARRALQLESENVAALGTLGDALLELGRYAEAFTAYDRAAAQGPSVGAYARVARARELLGRSDGALDALELAIEAGSGIREQKAWALMRYGGVLLSRGRVESAEKAFHRSLALQPRFPHARAGLARVAAVRDETTSAIDRLETVLRDVPSAEYATELGDLYLSLGADERADRAYDRARDFEQRLARNGVRTLLASASLDVDRGLRLRSALARARQAYREAPNVETEDLLAWALARNGLCAEARMWSQRSLELGTRDATFFFHRGMIERCLGNPAATRWFAEAIATDPGFSVRWAPVARRFSRDGLPQPKVGA